MSSMVPEKTATLLEIRKRLLSTALNTSANGAPSTGSSSELSHNTTLTVDASRWLQDFGLLKDSIRKIGEFPPVPNTVRGRLGSVLVRMVRRALFWYTPSIHYALDRLVRFLGDVRGALESRLRSMEERIGHIEKEHEAAAGKARTELETLKNAFQQMQARQAEFTREIEDQKSTSLQETARLASEIHERERAHRAETSLLQASIRQWVAQETARVHDDFVDTNARLTQEFRLLTDLHNEAQTEVARLKESLRSCEQTIRALRAEVIGQACRTSLFLEEARRSLPLPEVSTKLERFESIELQGNDALYAALEDQFRGTREEIKGKLRFYLDFLRDPAVPTDGAVLDLGCGRGEWLELLGGENIEALGIDTNHVSLQQCRENSLPVSEGDILEFLSKQRTNSLRAVTGFHIVEHFPFPVLRRILLEMFRVLRPGGIVILETPNPENLMVGAYSFYIDPTHVRPIPSLTLRFLLEASGFCDVRVHPVNPSPSCNLVPDTAGEILADKFNTYFYGPQDYGITGRKV